MENKYMWDENRVKVKMRKKISRINIRWNFKKNLSKSKRIS